MEHFELDGKTAVVLHRTTPAGHAIAAAYVEAGATVVDELQDGIDIVACAPDAFFAKPITDIGDDELAEVMARNFTAQFRTVRAASDILGDGGRIVLLTSVLGERGLPNCSAYCAAQGAVQNLVRAAAQELAPRGISINGIALGWMSWMSDRLDPADSEAARAIRFTIAKRAGTAEEVGALAVWLSGSGAGFVTGQIFAVDGGLLQHL